MNDTILPGSGFDTYETQDKVLIGMDASRSCGVAVRILQQQGFGVVGAAVRLSPADAEAIKAAKRAAKRLDIDCITLDAQDLFAQSGGSGEAFFAALLTAADRLGLQYIAVGRSARVELDADGTNRVLPGADAALDESAALAALPQEILARLLLPLGEFTGEDVQEMAREFHVEGE